MCVEGGERDADGFLGGCRSAKRGWKVEWRMGVNENQKMRMVVQGGRIGLEFDFERKAWDRKFP